MSIEIKEIDINRLRPPDSRHYADPVKVERMGPFDRAKYIAIAVEKVGHDYVIQDGLTRVEAARRAGLTKLEAKIYSASGD